MRQKLGVMSGERTTFRGQVERFGVRPGWKGNTEATILLVEDYKLSYPTKIKKVGHHE